MPQSVRPIPEGFHTVSPHLVVDGAAKAIEFYKKAFGAEEVVRMPAPDGKRLMHAEIRIGDSVVMLCDEFPEMGGGCRSPKALGSTCVTLHLYVNDADATFNRAVQAGATATAPLTDMFWGDRYGKVTDPFGHEWSIATHVKDVTPEEMQKAAAAAFGPGAG
jgi:uncharacterized glyoxalase superfamily protein PhnB